MIFRLEELCFDRNQLKELQNTLKRLKFLKILNLANNRLEKLPQFLINTKKMGIVDMYAQKIEYDHLQNGMNITTCEHNNNNLNGKVEVNPPLAKINLRANSLKGSIILGNYTVCLIILIINF